MKKIQTTITALIAILLVQTAAKAADDGTHEGDPNDADATFMQETAEALNYEIQAGNLAQTHAASQSVKDFARQMVADFQADRAALEMLGQSEGVGLPTEPDNDRQTELNRLSNLFSSDFDLEYISAEMSDHIFEVRAFATEVKRGNDFRVIFYSTDRQSQLLSHLQTADRIALSLGLQP